jgi:hypothetical protein
MGVLYIRGRPLYVHRPPDPVDLTVLDLAPEKEQGLSLGDRFRLLDPSLRTGDSFLFRAQNDGVVRQLEHDKILEHLLADCRVAALVVQDNKPSIVPLAGFKRIRPVALEKIQQAELLNIVNRAGALFEDANFHFVLPSGEHAAGFIDLRRILSDPLDVSRIADWIIPELTADTALISDTGILTPLLLQLQLESFRRFGSLPPIASMSGYPTDPAEMLRTIRDVRSAAERTKRIVLILSVNATGRLFDMFRELAPRDRKTIALFHSRHDKPPHEMQVLCTIPIERWKINAKGDCQECRRRQTVTIDRATLERRIKVEWKFIKPTKKYCLANREFWEAASATDAVRLHLYVKHADGDHHRMRHHGIYLDTARLFASSTFRTRFKDRLQKTVQPPDLVLVPKHVNSEHVCDLVREVFPKAQYQIVPARQFSEEIGTKVIESKSLLLADDGIVTGTTIFGFKQQIYQLWQGAHRSPNLDCFVAIARPADPQQLEDARRAFFSAVDGKCHLHYAYLVHLPPPGHDECPWCHERELLKKQLAELPSNGIAPLRDRLRVLEKELEVPFVLCGAAKRPAKVLTYGSYFGTLNEKAAFAAAASVAQLLSSESDGRGSARTSELEKSTSAKTVSNIVSAPFILTAFYDATFLSGFFRTLRFKHINFSGLHEHTTRKLLYYPAGMAYPGNVSELIWAALDRKLSRDAALRLAKKIRRPDPMLSALKELLCLLKEASKNRASM